MKLFFSFKTHEATTADYVETTLSPEEARDRALQCCKRLIKDLPASAIQKSMYALSDQPLAANEQALQRHEGRRKSLTRAGEPSAPMRDFYF